MSPNVTASVRARLLSHAKERGEEFEPVFLKWKGMETAAEGDFFVRSGPGTVKLPPESAREYIRTRFHGS